MVRPSRPRPPPRRHPHSPAPYPDPMAATPSPNSPVGASQVLMHTRMDGSAELLSNNSAAAWEQARAAQPTPPLPPRHPATLLPCHPATLLPSHRLSVGAGTRGTLRTGARRCGLRRAVQRLAA